MGADPVYILARYIRLCFHIKVYQHILVSYGSNRTLERLASLVEYHLLWDSPRWPFFIAYYVCVVSGMSELMETVINRNAVICGDAQSKDMDRPESSKGPKPSCLR